MNRAANVDRMEDIASDQTEFVSSHNDGDGESLTKRLTNLMLGETQKA